MLTVNSISYEIVIVEQGSKQIFSLINYIGICVGKIVFSERNGRLGKVYDISLLGTSNGGSRLDEIGLKGIEKCPEKTPGLLYIMFKSFIEYLRTINFSSFSLNIENPLLDITTVYRKLHFVLQRDGFIESGTVKQGIAVFQC